MLNTSLQFDWLIRGPSKAVLDFEKAFWTSNLVTIDSSRVLKDKLARIAGRELSGTCSNKNHRHFAENLPITQRRASKNL